MSAPVTLGVATVPETEAPVVVMEFTVEEVVTVAAVGLAAVGQLAPSFGDVGLVV